jgi:ribosome-binding protein aMBF1 (putative translation factor)
MRNESTSDDWKLVSLQAFQEIAGKSASSDFRKILEEEGIDCEDLVTRGRACVSRALAHVFDEEDAERTSNLSQVVNLLRRSVDLSQSQLAEKAMVALEEIERIEENRSYIPTPRCLAKLEDYFKLKPRTLAVAAGAVSVVRDPEQFQEGIKAFRFAACSNGMDELSTKEQALLTEFVRFVAQFTE